jgi:hypothetical protein
MVCAFGTHATAFGHTNPTLIRGISLYWQLRFRLLFNLFNERPRACFGGEVTEDGEDAFNLVDG